MKHLILFLLFSISISAQKTWFDANWNKTSADKGMYYRPTPSKFKKGFWVMDYYKNGKIKREGFVKNPSKNDFDGLVIEYFQNGNPSIRERYKKGILQGICKEFFESGELHKLYRYREGKQDGIWKEFHKNGKIKTKGKYKNGEKVGVWKTFYKNEYGVFLDDE